MQPFTLLHTNDFHHRLTEAQAERLRHLRDSLEGRGLLVDAGDAVGSGNITFRPGGETIHDLMNLATYDVSAVGNREFHFSRLGFETKLSRARFPHVCANVRPVREPAPHWTAEEIESAFGEEPKGAGVPTIPYWLHESKSGWRVLFFGLTVPMITEKMLVRKVSATLFDDPLRTAEALAPRLREAHHPDLLVALTHIGLSRDRLLAERVPSIDLIVGGHSHDRLEQGERVGETLIVQTGCYGKALGRVEISRKEGGRLRLEASLEEL